MATDGQLFKQCSDHLRGRHRGGVHIHGFPSNVWMDPGRAMYRVYALLFRKESLELTDRPS